MLIVEFTVLFCLGLICYQDLRYRAVYWLCFPVLAALLFFMKQQAAGTSAALIDAGIATVFFAVQLLLVWLYFSFKNKKPVNITVQYLGLGDILFLMALAFYLSPLNYVLFYVSSLIVVLCYTIIQRSLNKDAGPEIPLAGLQALLLGCLLFFSMIKPGLNPYTDAWAYGL